MAAINGWVVVTFGVLFIPGIKGEQTVFKKPEIHSLHIYSDIKYRFATTLVTSRIKNVDTQSREALFDVTLPNEAFITNLTLEIDGKIITGEIKEKEVAKKQYQTAQQRGESAGYIGTRHRETNRFNLAVTVASQSKVTFNLTYQELLKRTHGHYEQVIYIDPGQPIPDMDITVAIVESREITDLRVPPLRNDVMADIKDVSTITVITTPTPKTAHVKFVPSIEFQTAQSTSGMAGQFVVQYDVERKMDVGDVLLVNGYFVHFFAPEGFRPIPNDVLFILDTSGSMRGTKMKQLKQAMLSIIAQLNEGDRMNIMTFSGSISFWKTQMVDVLDEDTMEAAKARIHSLRGTGSTNIDLALKKGVTFLKDRSHTDGAVRSPVILFLTDGLAQQGVTNTEEILKNVRSRNEIEIPIFSLAFGENADYKLVKKISIQNNGLGRKIYEASDAAMQIAGLYNEISVTLLNNITFQYLDAPVTNVTKHKYTNYFNGSEMVICGRLENFEDFIIDKAPTLRIIGNSVDGPDIILSGELSNNLIDLDITDKATNSEDLEKITEKVWAYLTIKQLLDKELATSDNVEKQGYTRKILELSIKYGFVTPLTSMVVTLPDTDSGEHSEEEIILSADERRPIPKPGIFQSSGFSSHIHVYQTSRRVSRPHPIPVHGHSGSKVSNQRQYWVPPPNFSGIFQPSGFSSQIDLTSSRVSSPPHIHRYSGSKVSNMRQDKVLYSASASSGNELPYTGIIPPNPGTFSSNLNQIYQENRFQTKPKKKSKRKRKTQKKSKGSQFPLRVKFPKLADPLCFNMYDTALETAPDTYIFYSDKDTGLQIDVQLEKTLQGKSTKQGSIKEIHLTSGEHHEQLTSKTFKTKNVSTGDGLPWEVTFVPAGNGPTTEIKVKLTTFLMIVTANDGGYLNLMVERPTQNTLADTGIISQVLAKKVRVIKITSNPARRNKKGKMKPAKDKVILKVDGTRFVLKRRQAENPGTSAEKCWPMKQHEAKFLDMTSERII